MDEFVVCPSCGTRIKAGREFCLRCFEPLPTPERPIRPTMWVSLGLSDTKKQIVAVVAAALAVGLLAIILTTAPPAVDETARPAVAALRSAPTPPAAPATQPAPPATGEVASGAPVFEPTQAADAGPRQLSEAEVAKLESRRSSDEAELVKKPDDPNLLDDLGQTLAQLSRQAEAVPRFERAIALVPDNARYHSNLARALIQLNLWDRAVDEYREATRLRPEDFFAQYALALTLHRKGDDAAAIPEFRKALALDTRETSAHLWIGISLETVGRVPEAVKEYQTYLALQPSSPDAERLKAHVQALGGGQP